jgi:hypothetical protein
MCYTSSRTVFLCNQNCDITVSNDTIVLLYQSNVHPPLSIHPITCCCWIIKPGVNFGWSHYTSISIFIGHNVVSSLCHVGWCNIPIPVFCEGILRPSWPPSRWLDDGMVLCTSQGTCGTGNESEEARTDLDIRITDGIRTMADMHLREYWLILTI